MQSSPAECLLRTLAFAARKHSGQLRKSSTAPYINHPIAVAEIVASIGKVEEMAVLQAALLHDVLEDTDTPPSELERLFGQQVLCIVQEVTDDMHLPKSQRKARQIDTAPRLSPAAKLIRIADKISNVSDLDRQTPPDWSPQRKREYLAWAEKVVQGCAGANTALEEHFQTVLNQKRSELS